MSLLRPAGVFAATATLLAVAVVTASSISAHSLALDLTPLHRDTSPAFHTDTYNPATPLQLQFQTNAITPTPIYRHARHRAL